MRAKVNGTELFFDVEGPSLVPSGGKMVERPVCFVLHGGPVTDSSPLRPWMSPLTQAMQLVYVDYRGTGRAARPPLETCTLENLVDDLEALREYLGLDKVAILGHSFGGILGMPYAIKYPDSVSHLVLANTSPYWGEDGDQEKWTNLKVLAERRPDLAPLVEEYSQGYDKSGLGASNEEAREKFRKTMPMWVHRVDPATVAEIADEVASRTIFSTELSNWMMANEMRHYDVRPRLPEITAPTLIMTGRWDWRSTVHHAEAMHRGIPNSELVVFEDSAHMIYLEEPEKFVSTVVGFMERYGNLGD